MDDDKGVKKKKLLLLSLSAMKKKLLPPSLVAEIRVLSLLAALLFACGYGGLAAYNLRDGKPASCEQAPSRVMRCYELEGEDVVAAAGALTRGLVWCSAPQAAAAAAALLLLARRHGRGLRLRLRGLALVALAAAAANHWMYIKILGILRAISSPGGDLSLAIETAAIFLAAALDLLGFVAFLPGGDE